MKDDHAKCREDVVKTRRGRRKECERASVVGGVDLSVTRREVAAVRRLPACRSRNPTRPRRRPINCVGWSVRFLRRAGLLCGPQCADSSGTSATQCRARARPADLRPSRARHWATEREEICIGTRNDLTKITATPSGRALSRSRSCAEAGQQYGKASRGD
jgi:hypothetical protein